MWFSLSRRAYFFSEPSAISRSIMVNEPEIEWRSGTSRDRQDATVTVSRGVKVPGVVFWHSSRFSHGCFPTGH
eukprot:3480785-Pyramimonas_sp.AAC.1